jgi:hypothetical protein
MREIHATVNFFPNPHWQFENQPLIVVNSTNLAPVIAKLVVKHLPVHH